MQESMALDQIKQRREALKQAAAVYGYDCHDVVGDGNCFFYAIVDQLKRLGRTGQDIDPDILRMVAAVEIDEHRERYRDFIPDDERQDYAHNIAKPRAWVGLIVAQAIARIKNVIIAIIPSDRGRPQIIKPAGANEVIVLGNEVDFHFQSLRAVDPILNNYLPEIATEDLQRIIDETPTLVDNDIIQVNVSILPTLLQLNSRLAFFERLCEEFITEHRHEDPQIQQAYDRRFGLILRR